MFRGNPVVRVYSILKICPLIWNELCYEGSIDVNKDLKICWV